MKIVSENVIKSILEELEIDSPNVTQLTQKINTRIKLNKNIYKYIFIIFFFILKILRTLMFFLPGKIFYKFVFKFLSKLPSPLNLVYKLISSYVVLDCFE